MFAHFQNNAVLLNSQQAVLFRSLQFVRLLLVNSKGQNKIHGYYPAYIEELNGSIHIIGHQMGSARNNRL